MTTFLRIFAVRSFLFVLCIAAFSPCRAAFAQNASARPEALPAHADGQLSFDRLKGLAGTWTGQVTTNPPVPDINGPIQVTMRVASRGNVVVHEIAPGGVPEPTMIYLEDDRLTLVHYCEAGNRPRLVARKSPDPNSVDFDFVDISGSKSPVYLQHFTFTIINADHHTEDWTFMLQDNSVLHAHFDLKRVKEGASPAAAK
jgi:hypothetical protein